MPRLSKAERAVIAAGEQEVERQAKTLSKQPRFAVKATAMAFFNLWHNTSMDVPPYTVNSRIRDQWLQAFWPQEPHIAGVVNQVTIIDANRGWTVTGGRNQVARYTDILHNVDGGEGWRSYTRRSSLSFWTTDLGSVTEIGRDGKGGPMRDLYHVDPGRCYLTGNAQEPLAYTPSTGGQQMWGPLDFFRVCSMPSDNEAYRGLGFSALSRAVELVRVLYAVMQHDEEMLAAKAPKGLLLIQGITQDQWNQAMVARQEQMAEHEREYYGGVEVIASAGADQVDAKLVALSQLPANFDPEKFYNLSMYAIALCFGYDPSEFFPVQYGSLGRGTETEVMHQKATGKGGTDFALAHQERLQRELPDTLAFEYEQRDDTGNLAEETVKQAKEKTISAMYNAGKGYISAQEARVLAAEAQLLPPEWTQVEEDVTATDTEDAEAQDAAPSEGPGNQAPQPAPPAAAPTAPGVQQALESPQIQRAMAIWPREPIVQYRYHGGKATLRTIWQPGRHVWPVTRAADAILYKAGDVIITESDVQKAISDARKRLPAMADLLEATVQKE